MTHIDQLSLRFTECSVLGTGHLSPLFNVIIKPCLQIFNPFAKLLRTAGVNFMPQRIDVVNQRGKGFLCPCGHETVSRQKVSRVRGRARKIVTGMEVKGSERGKHSRL